LSELAIAGYGDAANIAGVLIEDEVR